MLKEEWTMQEQKRLYYRNYYQEHLAKKNKEEAVNEELQRTQETQMYCANHYYQTHHHEKPKTTDMTSIKLSRSRGNKKEESFKGALFVIPLLIGLMVVAYSAGLFNIPSVSDKVAATFGTSGMTYLTDYSELIVILNEMNGLIEENGYDASAIKTLSSYQSEIQTLTQSLNQHGIEPFERLTYLLQLSLSSVNQLFTTLNEPASTETVHIVVSQYITDQNSVNEQLLSELMTVLKEANLEVSKDLNGNLTIK